MSEGKESGSTKSCDQPTNDSQGSADSRQDACASEDAPSPSSSQSQGKDSNRRRSRSGKRRSGFSRGRVSISQLTDAPGTDLTGAELYKQIPVELPAAQRLSMLSRLQVRHALEVLDAEFADVPGFENVKAEALESVGATIDEMENDGRFEEMCTTKQLAANPTNLMMDSTISSLMSCIKKLEKEDAEWDDLVNTLATQEKTAQEQLQQLDLEYGDVSDRVKELSRSFLPNDLSPDLSAICADTIRDVKTVALLMDDYCQSVELLSIVHRAAGKHMDRLVSQLDAANKGEQCDPKDIIQQLLSC